MEIDLDHRNKKILQAVIQDYIQTAEPVGSRSVSKRHQLHLSPASIRNVMADLEDMGLLFQPHASAGRIPTDQGLRYYVDSILEVRDISGQIQDSILREFEGLNQEVEKVIKHSSRVLSSLSRSIGVVVAPSFNRLSIRQVQFLQVGPKTLLVVLVGSSGIVQNRIIEVDEELNSSDLLRFNNYLNDIFEGLTISEIKVKLVEEMRQEKNMFDKMLSRALTLGHKVFGQEMPDDVYIEGRVNLFEYPEFSDVEAMKSLFKTFEDKSIIVKLLDKTLSANGVQIFIGSENEMRELEGCTLIASRYTRGSRPLGTLGVIGPIRLNYSQIIPVVDYTAKLVSQILETNS